MRSHNEHHRIADAIIEIIAENHEIPSSVSNRIRSRITALLHQNILRSLTPPELAKELGVSADKILHWINTGELEAANVATRQTGRPRYRIDREAVDVFKKLRANQGPAPTSKRRSKKPAGVIEFF